MPNCFTLTKKGETEPTSLNDVDTDLWIKFNGGEPKGNTKWFARWYDFVGLGLSHGHSWDKLRSYLDDDDPDNLALINYLEETYEVKAWYQVH